MADSCLSTNEETAFTGVKRAVLLDYITVDPPSLLSDLMKLWKEGSQLKVITINGDHFIVNEAYFNRDHMRRSSTDTAVTFIDISTANPCLAKLPTLEASIARYVSERISDSESSVITNPLMNYCSVYGCVLGYPLVYHWSGDKCYGSDHLMDVVRCRVTIESNWLWQNVYSLFSFSFPITLEDQGWPEVRKWFQNLQTKHETVDLQMKLNFDRVLNAQLAL